MTPRPIAPICHRNLLKLAKAYSRRFGVSMATTGDRAYGNANLFHRIENGGSVTLRIYDDLVAWFCAELAPKVPKLESLDGKKPNGRAVPAGGRAVASPPAQEA